MAGLSRGRSSERYSSSSSASTHDVAPDATAFQQQQQTSRIPPTYVHVPSSRGSPSHDLSRASGRPSGRTEQRKNVPRTSSSNSNSSSSSVASSGSHPSRPVRGSPRLRPNQAQHHEQQQQHDAHMPYPVYQRSQPTQADRDRSASSPKRKRAGPRRLWPCVDCTACTLLTVAPVWLCSLCLLLASLLLLDWSSRLPLGTPSHHEGLGESLFLGRLASSLGSSSFPWRALGIDASVECPTDPVEDTAAGEGVGGVEGSAVGGGGGRALDGAASVGSGRILSELQESLDGRNAAGDDAGTAVGAPERAEIDSLEGLPSVTIFTAPQPFARDAGDPQLTALRSWLALPWRVRVVLMGQDPSLETVASMFPAGRVSVDPHVDCDFFGVPQLSSVLDLLQRHRAQELASRGKGEGAEGGDCKHEPGAEAQGESGGDSVGAGPVCPGLSASVLVSPDVLLSADLLPFARKLSGLSHRWAAMAATWQLQEEQAVPEYLLFPLRSSLGDKAYSGNQAKDAPRPVKAFLQAQAELRAYARSEGVLDTVGGVDFFAWGGEAWGLDLIPNRFQVPPLPFGHVDASHWMAGALATAAGLAKARDAREVVEDAKSGFLLDKFASELPLVVDASRVVTVVRVAHRGWDKRMLPKGRAWVGHGRKRKSRALGHWQALRTEFVLAELAQEESARLASLAKEDRQSTNQGKGDMEQGEERPLPGASHWTEVMLGGPGLAPYELDSCAEDEGSHMCLTPRMSPGRCRCEASPFVLASSGDAYPRPTGRQWLCGLNQQQMSPRDPALVLSLKGSSSDIWGEGRDKSALVSMEELLPFVAKVEKDGTRLVILVAVTGQYGPMLMNFVCNLRRLGLAKYLAVAAMDPQAYKFAFSHGLAVYYEGFQGVRGVDDASADGCGYRTLCFKQRTKVKSRAVLRVLKAGYAVLWADVDIVWFTNPLPELTRFGPGELAIQANEPRPHHKSKINSGFYIAHPDKRTIEAFENIVEHAAKSNKSEQPSFQEVLCGEAGPYKVKGKPECKHRNGLRTIFLDRKRYANGAIFDFWMAKNVTKICSRNDVVILHNNWILGKGSKEKRFVVTGFWHFDMQRKICSREPIFSRYRTTVAHIKDEEDAVLETLTPSAFPKIK